MGARMLHARRVQLTLEDELKMLRVARQIANHRPLRVLTTHLAAHAIPPEYKGRADAYIDEVAIPSLTAAHAEGLVLVVSGVLLSAVVLTNYATPDIRMRCAQLGVDAVFDKSNEIDALVDYCVAHSRG